MAISEDLPHLLAAAALVTAAWACEMDDRPLHAASMAGGFQCIPVQALFDNVLVVRE